MTKDEVDKRAAVAIAKRKWPAPFEARTEWSYYDSHLGIAAVDPSSGRGHDVQLEYIRGDNDAKEVDRRIEAALDAVSEAMIKQRLFPDD